MKTTTASKPSRPILLAAALLALAALACSVSLTPEPPTPAPTVAPPTSTPTPLPTDTRLPTFSLTVTNNSGLEICRVFVSAADASGWGDDQLGGDTIPNGVAYTLTDISTGVYDLRAEACNNESFAENLDADLTEGDFEWTISPAGPSLTLINNSDLAVCKVFGIAHSNPSPNFGANRLDDTDRIEPGESYVFTDFPEDEGYDLFAVACAGNVSWDAPNTRISTTTWELLDNGIWDMR